jgi:hypothetical protein
MNRWTVARLCAALTLAGGVLSAAQQLPSEPLKQFGSSITGAYEGWYDNPDGTHTFLVGYYNRNSTQSLDVPIGPNNRIEPGGPDMGQPTHFLPGRQYGMFTVTVPKEFPQTQRLTWTIVANGQSMTIPFTLKADYNVSPFNDLAVHNTPPALHLFDEKAPPIQGPVATIAKAAARTASMSAAMALAVWAADDAKYTSGTNAPMTRPRPPVALTWSKYRGPGDVTFDKAKPELEAITGGGVNVPYEGKATTNARFSAPGDYVLHVTGNDFSGNGGGGEVCCWTTAMVKVSVTP